jgi:hypothetical protein
MITCDLCGTARECLQKQIEGREYDICSQCWEPFEQKLKGKGRPVKQPETVLLPVRPVEPERQEPKPGPRPGEPPTIWGRA